jgi:hypothetical protein
VTGRQKQLPPGSPVRQLGGRGVLRSVGRGVAEEARTRGFAAPAFAGCACFEVARVRYVAVRGPSSARDAWGSALDSDEPLLVIVSFDHLEAHRLA